MEHIYFARITDNTELNNKTFMPAKDQHFDVVKPQDLVLVKTGAANNYELWEILKIINSNNAPKLKCRNLYSFSLKTEQLVSLKLFILDRNLLNQTNKPNKGILYNLSLIGNSLNIFKNKNLFFKYIQDENNYRKLIICDSENETNENSEDVQIYKVNNNYNLFPASFIDKATIVDVFKSSNYLNGKYASHTKGKLYKLIKANKKVITKQDCSLVGFYDLFISSISSAPKNKRTSFIEWCKINGIKKASTQYENGIRAIEKEFNVDVDEEYAKDKCQKLLEDINKNEKVIRSIRTLKNNERSWATYLKKYIEFKNAEMNNSSNEIAEDLSSNTSSITNPEMDEYLKTNTIFYGVPGCGKSYKINKLLSLNTGNKDTELNNKYYKRILFHPEYTYSDFIGQVMPTTNGDRIEYKFRPGPFVEILCDAIKDKNHNYYLVIEEINRGNAPAIFGDIFQLLDRTATGESEYPVYNTEILSYFKEQNIYEQSIKIPSNLTILATMNTCDQNVFTLDTAFKRRWRMCRIENNFEDKDQQEFLNTPIKNLKITWKEFAQAFNADLLKTSNDGLVAEDKQLGTHFVSLNELGNDKYFAEKIFMYIWNDVVKYNKEQLFKPEYKTLDDVIKAFCSHKNVFNDSCEEMQKLYKKLEETSTNM